MKNNIPEVGKWYYFFDDGKISPSRCYKAKVIRVVPYNANIFVDKFDYKENKTVATPIQTVHKNEVDDHRQSENFIMIGRGGGVKPGDPWLYAETTDFFVECEIPGYDENTLWFARTVDGGWFSMEIQSSWQCGSLDVDFSIYNEACKTFGEMSNNPNYYDECLKLENEFIS